MDFLKDLEKWLENSIAISRAGWRQKEDEGATETDYGMALLKAEELAYVSVLSRVQRGEAFIETNLAKSRREEALKRAMS